MNKRFRVKLALLAAACLPAPAVAAGSVDVSASVATFASPSNAYGPWVYEDIDVQLPPSAQTGIHFENRRASDLFNPNTEQSLTVDQYLHVTRGITGYASAQFGSGAPYVRDRFTAELDAKAGRPFVIFMGGSLGSGYGVGSLQQLYGGVYYYRGDGYVSFRYSPAWSSVLGSTQGYLLTVALGHPQRTTETFRIGTGGEYDVSLITPVNPTLIGEREFNAGLSVKHWVNPASGYHIDLQYGSLNRTNGPHIYARTGLGAGFFFALP